MRSKTAPITRFLSLLALVALAGPGCAWLSQFLSDVLQKPTLHFQKADLRDLSFEGLTLDLGWRVDNPNDFGVKLASIGYDLKVDGNQFTSGSSDRGLDIAAKGSSDVSLPFSVKFKDLTNALLALYKKDQVGWNVGGHFGFDTPAGVAKIPYKREGQLPVPKLPAVRLDAARVAGMSLTGARLEVDLGVGNNNQFQLPLDRLSYALKVAGREVATGSSAVAAIPAGGNGKVTLPVQLSFTDTGRAVYDAIRAGEVDIGVAGDLGAGPVKVPVNLTRRMNLR